MPQIMDSITARRKGSRTWKAFEILEINSGEDGVLTWSTTRA